MAIHLTHINDTTLQAFNFRFPPHHVNPLTNCPPSLSNLVEQVLLPKYRNLAKRFATACAVALDFPETDFFSRHLNGFDLATLRMLHYPPCDWDDSMSQVGNVSQALRINEHTDFGLFVRFLKRPMEVKYSLRHSGSFLLTRLSRLLFFKKTDLSFCPS